MATSTQSMTRTLHDSLRRYYVTLAFVGFVALVWVIYIEFFRVGGNLVFPSIGNMVHEVWLERNELITRYIQTGQEIVLGFVLAVSFALVLAVILSESRMLREAMLPLFIVNYSTPHLIFAPLFMLWFGLGTIGIGLFVMWAGFFPIFVNALTGLTQIEQEYIDLGKSLEATRWQFIKEIKIPLAAPHIVSGLKIGIQQAVVGAIGAEFIAGGSGIGYKILIASKQLNNGLLFGATILTIALTFVFYLVVVWILDSLTPPTIDIA